jgi:hypothetical protein
MVHSLLIKFKKNNVMKKIIIITSLVLTCVVHGQEPVQSQTISNQTSVSSVQPTNINGLKLSDTTAVSKNNTSDVAVPITTHVQATPVTGAQIKAVPITMTPTKKD